MRKFDIIIIGGGPSGAICGIELQKNGFSTCIIDKSAFPREKLCGGLLTQKSIDLIQKHCPGIEQNQYIVDMSQVVDFYHKDEKINNFRTAIPYYFTDRKKFDFLLIETYKRLGGLLYENCRITKDDIDTGNETVNVKNERFSYRVLIGADGCNSVLTRKREIRRFDSFCIEGELVKKNIEEKEFRVYFGQSRNGYGWYFPKKDYYSVGIGDDNGDKTIRDKAELFFEKIAPASVCNIRGASIPSGRQVSFKKLAGNTLLIGDSAGFIDPITGEGLYYALHSGILAAESIIEAVELNPDRIKKIYQKKTSHIRSNVRSALFLQKILYYPPVLDLFMNFIKRHKSFALFYLERVISTNEFTYSNFILLYLLKYRRKLAGNGKLYEN